MEKGKSTMSCVDHKAPAGSVMMNASVDLSEIVSALKEISKAFKDQKITVEKSEPDVIELAPIVNVAAQPAAQITVQPAPMPDINVHPAETVIMTPEGTKVSPKIDVVLPMKPFYIGVSIPSVLFLIDILLRILR